MSEANFLYFQGNTVTLNLAFTDSDGDPVDITGYTIYFTLKENKYDDEADAIITEDVTTHVNPTGGISKVELSAEDTAELQETYYYDLVYKVGAVVKAFANGVMTFQRSITERS